MKKIILASLCAIGISGCATIFSPSSDQISFNTTPADAKIYINGGNVGKTPLMTPVQRELSSPMVVIKKDGYETQNVPLQTKFNNTSWLNIFFWPGFIVDAATGSLMRYSVLTYDITLDKKD